MKPTINLLSNHEDLQVRVMQEVARAVHDAATEMCLREGNLTPGAVRWALSEGVVVSIFAFLLSRTGPERAAEICLRLMQDAAIAVEKGQLMPLERLDT